MSVIVTYVAPSAFNHKKGKRVQDNYMLFSILTTISLSVVLAYGPS
jgi:hypothetical protein